MKQSKYDFKKIEAKWQKKWLEEEVFRASDASKKPKYYQLETFPYPSAAGLHVGHPKGYIAEDIHAHFMRMQGHEVLYTMGWDAFGLPTENYAIKIGKTPREVANSNISNYIRQVRMFGFSYDWDREINTSDPNYYKWTQWLFIELYKKGLAYRAKSRVNWCPKDQTVLANEQVQGGVCERCGTEVEQREMEQWFVKITDYAERLLIDLRAQKCDWPGATLKRQEDWIGKSEGAMINFLLDFKKNPKDNERRGPKGERAQLSVFTTRPDTLFGATYLVLAPEHLWVTLATDNNHDVLSNKDEVRAYVETATHKTELMRQEKAKEKTGVELKGVKAINPATNEEISIWVADYVLGSYGTGAIMAVPAHDERDYEFAKKFNLPVKQVIRPAFGLENKKKEAVHRNTIGAIVRDKGGKILLLKWKEYDWVTPIIGGIEEGESPGDAAVREAFEETGFKTRVVRISDIAIESHFYAAHKNEWRSRFDYPVLLELVDEKQEKISEDESKKHELIWVDAREAIQMVSFNNNKLVLDTLLNNRGAYAGSPYTEKDLLINSQEFDGKDGETAKWEITKFVGGERKVQYKLRDWSVSRQRYWGVPIPMIYCDTCGVQPVPENDLPVILPDLENYRPHGVPPLASSAEFMSVKCPKCGGEARRDPETLDTFVDSSWYYFRYTDPKNSKAIFDKDKAKHWLPVDLYVIGAEHTVLHLLYSRFITKFLFDTGYISFTEPFLKLRHQGLIQGSDGQKMSKSKGNVVNPDEIVGEFGADTVRLYEMFMGPFEDGAPWDPKGILGMWRFLSRVWKFGQDIISGDGKKSTKEVKGDKKRIINATIKKVGEDITAFHFNTAISSLMVLLRTLEEEGATKNEFEIFIKLLYPFAPHISQELWSTGGHDSFVDYDTWPSYDKTAIESENFVLVIQVNGRVRGNVKAGSSISENEAKELAMNNADVTNWLKDKKIKKVIFVPKKLINFVIE